MSWPILSFPTKPLATSELEVRRCVDRAIGRALVDPHFAVALLADPASALETMGGGSARDTELKDIRAASLQDFALQASEVLWPAVQPTRDERLGSHGERRSPSVAA